ncbi:DUF2141 domain-containing protein [uncultured Erythrobacter sp.]|uniref:DUF2141 domain-containing protein n=1 Tax=uncultured Erythrobacter sp. TaxID=263913 RepID=UPI00265A127B|nr:DUF2141 domain-containing protein [uncultured Erythrobacter sp.]
MKASALVLAGLGASFGAALAAAPAQTGEVVITVTDIRSAKGVVRACMTTRADIFPKCIKDPAAHRTVVPANGKVEIRFTGVKPGQYAIALLHDENNNGKADRAMGMMPKEGYGFSRDAPVRMAPPKFTDAVFALGAGTSRVTIKMRYFL